MPKTTKTTTSINNGEISFEITIPLQDIKAKYQEIVAKTAQTAEIKGFRKGKAPLAMVEQSLDKSRVYTQILDSLVPTYYYQEVTKQKISPITDPEITPKVFEEDKDWVFSVKTAVKPEVELGDYKKYIKKALTDFEKAKKPEAKIEPGHEGHDHEGDAKLTVIFDTLLKEAKVEIAPMLINQEAKAQLSRLIKQFQQLKIELADFAKSQKKTQEELVKDYENTAETNLKLELILDKLVTLENPEVTDEEVAKLNAPKGQEVYAKYVIQKQKIVDILKKL